MRYLICIRLLRREGGREEVTVVHKDEEKLEPLYFAVFGHVKWHHHCKKKKKKTDDSSKYSDLKIYSLKYSDYMIHHHSSGYIPKIT